MVRPFGVKGQKRKRKEKYDRDEEEGDEDAAEPTVQAASKKAAVEEKDEKEMEVKEAGTAADEMAGIPIVQIDLQTKKPGVIFVRLFGSCQSW
ncbi:unnamed protein product [Linum trigynum]|uniref:Uncharacterized protein n=1 Tax=Linum trigynum TaxID=586398 RepID=A0AAV2DJ99_9ROSI